VEQVALPVIKERLSNAHITSYSITLPYGQDINDFFLLTANPKETFNNLVAMANPAVKKENKLDIHKTDFGFIMTMADRKYEVRGIGKKGSKLKGCGFFTNLCSGKNQCIHTQGSFFQKF
jgi:hypothetical protein